jgi:tetratricopeptide (TPR) repeat protein
VGVVVELAPLGRPADAVTTFWAGSDTLRSAVTEAAQAAAMRVLLHQLLEPAALWIATRLTSQQLVESDVSRRLRLLSGRRLREQLAGLRMQLAGQMSLYAASRLKEFDRRFAEQALDDLAESARRLPEYFRPHSTRAAVLERLGWSYLRGGKTQDAASAFSSAVRGYDAAAKILSAAIGADPAGREAALERVMVRRAKCRVLSCDRAYLVIARQELAVLSRTIAAAALDLYNVACMFAVAMASPDLPPYDRPRYARQAWHMLGCALLAEGESGLWVYLLTDIELDAMDAQQRAQFCAAIKTRHPSRTALSGAAARLVVEDAMVAIGIEPHREWWRL